jgi:bloom syndrome protein
MEGKNPFEMDVRMSPRLAKIKQATKTDRKRTSRGGSAAMSRSYPMSTNVSSPLQPKSRKRKSIQTEDEGTDDGDYEYYENGYARDSFVVGDNEETDEEDAFEPVTVHPRKGEKPKRRQLGEPITIDERMASLDDLHRDVVEDFVQNAKEQCRKIQMDKGLRQQPFSDTVLREMAMSFPRTTEEMKALPGINPNMVDYHGSSFLNLIAKAKNHYNEMRRDQDERVYDPNLEVIEILDDSDDEDYGSEPSFEGGESGDGGGSDDDEQYTSSYFPNHSQSANLQAFQERIASIQQYKASATAKKPRADSAAPFRRGGYGRGKGSGKGRRGFNARKSGSRKPSGSTVHSTTGVNKRPSKAGAGASRSKSGGRGGAGEGAGFGMMPI